MTDLGGRPMGGNAKPVVMTFYDYMKYAYTSTFYVKDEASGADCRELIKVVSELSECVLGKYVIGHEAFWIPTWHEAVKSMRPGAIGTFKWAIKYRASSVGSLRTHTIPGRDVNLSLGARLGPGHHKRGKEPDPEHPTWKAFLDVFRRVCVSKDKEPIPEYIELTITSSNWPPKGHK